MNFYQKYELERLIADGETKTFRATENATGRAVYLHFFNPEGLGLLTALELRFAKTPAKPELPLIELGEFAGTPYAVTLPIEQFTTFRRWLDSQADSGSQAVAELLDDVTVEMPKPAPTPRPQPVPAPLAHPAAPVAGPPGEFTRLFESPQRGPGPPAQPGEFTRMFESPKNPPTTASPQPGEFTRMFESPKNPPAQPPQAGEFTRMFGAAPDQGPPAPQQGKSSTSDAGEFTRLSGAPPTPAKPDPPRPAMMGPEPPRPPSRIPAPQVPSWPVSAPSDETGQFTKLFGSGPSGEAINIEEEQARAARMAQPESRPFQAPTEFTRVFGPSEGAAPRPSPPLRSDTASGIFGSNDEAKTAAPTKSGGPGEYTRVTSRAELEAEQAALGGTQPPAAAPLRRGLIVGLAIGAMVLLVLLIVILIVASKR